MAEARTRIYRADYQAPHFYSSHVTMDIDLDLDRTVVTTRLSVSPNNTVDRKNRRLELDGENLELLWVSVDGRRLSGNEYVYSNDRLYIPEVKDAAVVETAVAVAPRGNTTAMGLCQSHDGEMFTQCESEGFRQFSFGMDRPDVLSTFDVVLRGKKSLYPVMLSNGHRVASGELAEGRHWVRWQDPGPKPTYLFALFAGNLSSEKRTFTTRSGRLVEVGLYAPPKYIKMSAPALDFVIAAMEWDEKTFGREYDLATFNVGVMNGFAGAMENKGLNLFDLAWLAVSDLNTTDDEYEYRLKSVAHEYFHHWSGNRVTVKNWFQVSLKEGLTRFRDQLFLADRTEFTSVRIKMARHLRANQFTEDDSALAHAPVWDSYIEPRNVYTNTVYDKGQEAIFMLMAMLGRERFCEVVSAYFDRYTDQAVSIEEFLEIFESEGKLDLRQFRNWYYQAGLTEVFVRSEYDASNKRFIVNLKQRTRSTTEQPEKQPHHIPFAVALLDPQGREMATQLAGEAHRRDASTRVLEMRKPEQSFIFEDVAVRPVLSRLRGFSAPVRVVEEISPDDMAFLTRNDPDPFARWDAGQSFASHTILKMVRDRKEGIDPQVDANFLAAFTSALSDPALSPRIKADMLTLPDERSLGEATDPIDVDGIHNCRNLVAREIAIYARDNLIKAFEAGAGIDVSDRGSDAVGRRRLKSVSLDYLARLDEPLGRRICLETLERSKNFTDQVAALNILAERECSERAEALAVFRERNGADHLALDRWYRAQAGAARDDTADTINSLMNAPDFDPIFSRLFALAESFFAYNRYGVNVAGGRGHQVFAAQILHIDSLVPMIAGWAVARSDMSRWFKFDLERRLTMRAALEKVLAEKTISRSLYETCAVALKAGEELGEQRTGNPAPKKRASN